MNRYLAFASDLLAGKPAALRSPEWERVEREHLQKEPVCQWCGSGRRLQVHHIKPFHLYPELELVDTPEQLITLCEEGGEENCHFIRGHGRNWKGYVPTVRADCQAHQRLLADSSH